MRKNHGITLVELLVVIAIIGILATAVITIFNPIEQLHKSADAKKKGDLAQIQRALEIYNQDYGRYPKMSSLNEICATLEEPCVSVGWGESWSPYMDILPQDKNTAKTYAYWTDSTGQSYALYASLERGAKDNQVCKNSSEVAIECLRAQDSNANISCGGEGVICDYGVTSPNITP